MCNPQSHTRRGPRSRFHSSIGHAPLIALLDFRFFCCVAVLLLGQDVLGAEKAVRQVNLPVDASTHRINGNGNDLHSVLEEVLNPTTLKAVAACRNISIEDFSVTVSPERGAAMLNQLSGSPGAFDAVREELQWYIAERGRGHTRTFLLNCLTNPSWQARAPSEEIKYLLRKQPRLPTALLQMWQSGAYTNQAGSVAETGWRLANTNGEFVEYQYTNLHKVDEIVTWTNYVLIDGEFAWVYQVRHPPTIMDGVTIADAKEFDPKLRDVFVQAEKEAVTTLHREGKLWPRRWQIDRVKKQLLSKQGIAWRSPTELVVHPQRDWDMSP